MLSTSTYGSCLLHVPQALIAKVHSKGMHWVPIIDPGIMVNPQVSALHSSIFFASWRRAECVVGTCPFTLCLPSFHLQDAAYTDGMAKDVFLKDVTGKPYVGQVCSAHHMINHLKFRA